MANNTQHPLSADAQSAVALLESALSSALDNLPDVAGDSAFSNEAIAECCKDIAAMAHLLAVAKDGLVNIAAYL